MTKTEQRIDDAGAGTGSRTAEDDMLRQPSTLSATATIADVRALLAGEHVHMALLLCGDHLLGTVIATDLGTRHEDDGSALTVATLEGRTVAPDTSLALLRAQMVASGQRRYAVVDSAGRLLGLLCLKRYGTGFCSDRDVASRRSATAQ